MAALVIVYSTPSCHFCAKLKNFLKKNNVKFVEYDVSSDSKKKEEMIEKSGQVGVPVIDVDGRIIIGYRLSEIAEALKL